ncbi:hypothetical protein [Streptomyces solicathayae]|uniref:Uncharacterized protein n=1 Tax=Streptomyces solicathayae TaxID=3081768 RepID=A0ABZ0LYU7_9ACTN|nr:hypothetical protein [Streptomyces sp. HUAS YS2]WOX24612.1 hypothetical protein R2D22_25825 [Streptomyces sp. HUAS YS2]
MPTTPIAPAIASAEVGIDRTTMSTEQTTKCCNRVICWAGLTKRNGPLSLAMYPRAVSTWAWITFAPSMPPRTSTRA